MLSEASRAESLFERTASPREKKRVQRIEDIIDTAAMIFVRDGYAQFSARRVASEMGISLSNLQHYCGTTENLLLSMIRAKIEVFVTQFVAIASDTSRTAEERLVDVIEQDMEAARDPWIASFSFQSWALAEHDHAVGEHLTVIYETFCRVMGQLIQEVNPQLTKARADVFAVLIASQIEGLLFYHKHTNALSQNWQETVDTTVAMWLTMIRAG
ncbi:TetR/AcrR family transcriptional regulator [Pseudomonas typographi]|uniref:TetR/AcrR family transcriptional regulator n=1 Tax=Pseudomonas typographi TaxID=2715964 RepID=A0ABR7Z327_9PSED|nr:TetR/AcrR family transcriptional regulator [Pseudomonas typographi]MBD1554113.1 TetR/AcrR family transcriptional regulator [Pseudomonas typographi]MBD1588562.1 TetR/AcrR family transcriptional regulator [Pseudomonas typographi]MBD1599819.1 TetR/AcrR family transcriptional regulator [Pseudomonas typographi]